MLDADGGLAKPGSDMHAAACHLLSHSNQPISASPTP
jgi:hypothetical protein